MKTIVTSLCLEKFKMSSYLICQEDSFKKMRASDIWGINNNPDNEASAGMPTITMTITSLTFSVISTLSNGEVAFLETLCKRQDSFMSVPSVVALTVNSLSRPITAWIKE